MEKDDYGIGGLLGNVLYMHGQIGLDMVVKVPSKFFVDKLKLLP